MKYRLMAFLMLAESKLKSWIIKYGRRDSVELLLQSYLVSPLGFDHFCHRFECCFPSNHLVFGMLCGCFLLQTFIEGHRFFDQYEMIFAALKQAAEVYVKSDSSSKTLFYSLIVCTLCIYVSLFRFLDTCRGVFAYDKRILSYYLSYYQFHVTGSKTCNRGKSKNQPDNLKNFIFFHLLSSSFLRMLDCTFPE